MIPGLVLIEKLVVFGIDLFVRSRAKREELRRSFDKFFRASGEDSQVSSDLHTEHQRMQQWLKTKKASKK